MPVSYNVYILLFFLFLGLSAFISALEVAFLAVQKARLRYLALSGTRGAVEAERITQRPDRLLATTLFSNNLVQTAAAALGTIVAVDLLGVKVGALAATIGIALATLFLAEAIPKTFAARHAERLALLFSPSFRLLETALSPIVAGISWFTARISGGPLTAPSYQVSEEEIRSIISVGEEAGAVEEAEAEMLHKVFEFTDRQVGEVMTPRTEVVWVEKGTRVRDFLAVYARNAHSRFPVYQDSTDNVVGILAMRDLLLAQAQGTLDPAGLVDGLMRRPVFVPETKRLGELLTEMQTSGNRMALVVDEYGGIAGIATMQRLLEEIVGEFRDELTGSRSFQSIDEHTLEVEGSMRLEEANKELELKIPAGEYETVAGFILSRLGRIPRVGEQVRADDLKLVVSQMRGLKIEKVLITRVETKTDGGSQEVASGR